jgi:tetratricopeptide (TPR) repeat protein
MAEEGDAKRYGAAVAKPFRVALDMIQKGKYDAARDQLLPIVGKPIGPYDEQRMAVMLGTCYAQLADYSTGCPFANRSLQLAAKLFGTKSNQYHRSIDCLCSYYGRAPNVKPAMSLEAAYANLKGRNAIVHCVHVRVVFLLAKDIIAQSSDYTKALSLFEEALVISRMCAAPCNRLLRTLIEVGRCHIELGEYAIAWSTFKEAQSIATSKRGAILCGMARICYDLKQYEHCMRFLEEAKPICAAAQDDDADYTEWIAATWVLARNNSCIVDRTTINVGHDVRMCTWCAHISDQVRLCACKRAWYCNEECQREDWYAQHWLNCIVCAQCERIIAPEDKEAIRACKRCGNKSARYCNIKCMGAHWPTHRKVCGEKKTE